MLKIKVVLTYIINFIIHVVNVLLCWQKFCWGFSLSFFTIIFMENIDTRNIKSEFLSLCVACELMFLMSEQGVWLMYEFTNFMFLIIVCLLLYFLVDPFVRSLFQKWNTCFIPGIAWETCGSCWWSHDGVYTHIWYDRGWATSTRSNRSYPPWSGRPRRFRNSGTCTWSVRIGSRRHGSNGRALRAADKGTAVTVTERGFVRHVGWPRRAAEGTVCSVIHSAPC